MRLPPEMTHEFVDAVRAAAARDEVRRAVGHLYTAVQDAIDLRRPVCNASGRCCKFDDFGHRLFITTMELSAFLAEFNGPPASIIGEVSANGCPFQMNGLCAVHAIRPFGCRIFFCDKTAETWQQDQYGRFHSELKRLHEVLDVPYFYVEWREALKAMKEGTA
jgi:hypothetical protein